MALELIGSGGGGMAVTRKILRFDFDHTIDPDPTVESAGTTVTTTPLTQGTVIENAWVAIAPDANPFQAGQPYIGLYVNFVPVGDPDSYNDLLSYDLTSQQSGGYPIDGFPLVNATTHPDRVSGSVPCMVKGVDCDVAIHLESDTPLTDGAGTLYILYSEPV